MKQTYRQKPTDKHWQALNSSSWVIMLFVMMVLLICLIIALWLSLSGNDGKALLWLGISAMVLIIALILGAFNKKSKQAESTFHTYQKATNLSSRTSVSIVAKSVIAPAPTSSIGVQYPPVEDLSPKLDSSSTSNQALSKLPYPVLDDDATPIMMSAVVDSIDSKGVDSIKAIPNAPIPKPYQSSHRVSWIGWLVFLIATVIMPFFVTYGVDNMVKNGRITTSIVITAILYGGIIFIMHKTRESYTSLSGRTKMSVGGIVALILGVPFMLFLGILILGGLMSNHLVTVVFISTVFIHSGILLRAAVKNTRISA